ncbi:MAG: phytanoyl-CoA dioxygenase family protein [Verrucomicrobiota bacterium]
MEESLEVRLEEDGFAVTEDVMPATTVEALREETDPLLEESRARGGARNVLERSACLRAEAEDGVAARFAKRVLGPGARPTKLTVFNKSPDANWLIRWHQDSTITVRERRETPGFVGWSVKEGVVHVHPPAEVLEGVLALRLHLDDTPVDNGALRVLPGSHRFGLLSRDAIQEKRGEITEETCEVLSGGMMLMRPLLLHASAKASVPRNRRVLHFEYSAAALPGGLEWA